MSKRELKEIAEGIVIGLIERGSLPHGTELQEPYPSGTDGYCCELVDLQDGGGGLDVWLDSWRSNEKNELYYGFWSSQKQSILQVVSIFCAKDEPVRIRARDQIRVTRRSDKKTEVVALRHTKKETIDCYLIHFGTEYHWFGRYTSAVRPTLAIPEAIEFFDQVLRSERETRSEGALKISIARRYERDPALRAAAIHIHGCRCYVCKMDFAASYGKELGKGFIHVHHRTPVAHGEGNRKPVDPRTDLTPVCPNCHAMLHRRDPPLDPDDLRKCIKPQ